MLVNVDNGFTDYSFNRNNNNHINLVREDISNFIIHMLGFVLSLYLIEKETCEEPTGMFILFVGVIL